MQNNINGNRQSETRNAGTMPYVYSPPNWLVQKGSETRPRTANGNILSTSTASFAYDGYNRLVTSQTAAETTTYTYNALGQRIKKINQNGLATSFHYVPDGELLYEQDQAGNTKAYVWLDGRPLARIDNKTPTPTPQHQHPNTNTPTPTPQHQHQQRGQVLQHQHQQRGQVLQNHILRLNMISCRAP